MKNIKISLVVISILLSNTLITSSVKAVDCNPAWDWSWTTTESCDWLNWFKVYWNIYVQDHTITMWSNNNMWIDLWINKITFTSWSNSKILLDPTAKIANHVSNRYYIAMSFSDLWITWCPTWMSVFKWNTAPVYNATSFNNSNAFVISSEPMPTSWTMYCWTKWN